METALFVDTVDVLQPAAITSFFRVKEASSFFFSSDNAFAVTIERREGSEGDRAEAGPCCFVRLCAVGWVSEGYWSLRWLVACAIISVRRECPVSELKARESFCQEAVRVSVLWNLQRGIGPGGWVSNPGL